MGLAVVTVLALLASACGDGGDGQGSQSSDLRVALVTDIGGLNDRGFNALANKGLERAEDELGVAGRVFISDSASDYVPNLTQGARSGYDLVIGVGFLMGDALSTVAKQFPDTNFAIVDFPWAALKDKPANARGLVFAEQEAGYLVGVAAATAAGGGSVSAVGGQAVPAVVAFLAGYRTAVQDTDPGMTVQQGYSQDFVDQAKCKELALTQIARGSKAVFAADGGCGLGGASGGAGARRLGHRRRQRPVVPRPAHPHERDEEGRRRGLRHDRGRDEGLASRAGATRSTTSRTAASATAR